MALDIDEVNAMSGTAFVETFSGVLEDSPHLAAIVGSKRPFAQRDSLVMAFVDVVERLSAPDALHLLLAHPELGARIVMTAESTAEQRSAGLGDADVATLEIIAAGNRRYRDRFGFPFILAVRGRSPEAIVAEMARRTERDAEVEFSEALGQVAHIARLRVEAMVAESGATT